MFPLVHYFVNKKIYQSTEKLLILGGLWPDLAGRTGFDRNRAHAMGDDFYRWCQAQAPEALPLARGVLGHGIEPHCVDHYADELWGEGPKGWCFQMGRPYEQAVGRTTGLGPEYAWWKSHNFVEICGELYIDRRFPGLGAEILAATQDETTLDRAAAVLSAYCGCPPERVRETFALGGQIFTLTDLSYRNLAEKQAVSIALRLRDPDHVCDVPSMADLLAQMDRELDGAYEDFLPAVVALCRPVMERYR